jgi:hypothetical protein
MINTGLAVQDEQMQRVKPSSKEKQFTERDWSRT